jgi:UDP-2,3-diacylglucosamine pyrophosphatase LpxH
MADEAKRTKRYFISDIHLTDDDSHAAKQEGKPYPYSWIGEDRINLLAGFLDKLAADPTTRDVVILGDLFDNWVCPAEQSPPKFDAIIGAKANKEVIVALNNVVSKGAGLFYVYGNHDMLMDGADLENAVKGIKVIGSGQKSGAFINGRLIAEHGHKYCLMNAPATDKTASYLPSGHFITRIVTQRTAVTGEKVNQFAEFCGVVTEALGHPADPLVEDVLFGMGRKSGMDKTSPIMMSGIDNTPGSVTLGDRVDRYGNDYDSWGGKNGVTAHIALDNDMARIGGNLYRGADEVYLAKKTHNIVIFGHTHYPELRPYPLYNVNIDGNGVQQMLDERETIYANCGSWVDECEKPTFVEVEKSAGGKRRYVRLGWVDPTGKSFIKEEYYVAAGGGD